MCAEKNDEPVEKELRKDDRYKEAYAAEQARVVLEKARVAILK
jgi:hypothetical protein